MQLREVVSDIGVGAIGGYLGTQLMERVSMKLYEWESEEARSQEDEARPGEPAAHRRCTQDDPAAGIGALGGADADVGDVPLPLRARDGLGSAVHVPAPIDYPQPDLSRATDRRVNVDLGGRRADAAVGLQRPQPGLPTRNAP